MSHVHYANPKLGVSYSGACGRAAGKGTSSEHHLVTCGSCRRTLVFKRTAPKSPSQPKPAPEPSTTYVIGSVLEGIRVSKAKATRSEFAKALEVTPLVYKMYLKGRPIWQEPQVLERVCRKFNVFIYYDKDGWNWDDDE